MLAMSSGGHNYTLEQSLEFVQSRKRVHTNSIMSNRRQQRSMEEEIAKLKEMLQQSLKREVDALTKIKHLQEMYQELLYRQENQQSSSPEDSTSGTTGFPQLVIVRESGLAGTDNKERESENTNQLNQINNGSGPMVAKQVSLPANTASTLAPIPIGLKDVRFEREKPPNPEIIYVSKSPSPTIELSESTLKKMPFSHSDEHINKSSSSPARKRTGSFWKRRPRNISETENMPECFNRMFKNFKKSSTLKVDPLKKYLGLHWSVFCVDKQSVTPKDNKYRDAVWELFQEETKYLTRQLQPLEQIYKGFLEELHFHGILEDAKIDKIFANISELCELSLSIASDLLKLFENRTSQNIAQPNELILSFSMFGHKFNPIYKCFCTNYEQQRGYIRNLEKLPHFQEYIRVCRADPSVERSDLNDLLIAPMQHQCHYKLLLDNVLKYTTDPNHRAVLHSTIKAFVVSLKELESAIAQQKCSLELLELSEMIHWPPVTHLSMDTYVPQSLVDHIQEQPCSLTLLKSSSRYLKLQGMFKLLDPKGRPYIDIQLILLNDLLLVTEIKGQSAKKSRPYSLMYQPFPPDYISVHLPIESPPRSTLTIIYQSPLGQQLVCITLLASSEEDRNNWVTELCTLGVKKI